MRALRLVAASAALVGPVATHEFKAGDLTVDHPTSRPTPPGATVGVGYLSIRNDGAQADRLIGGSAPVAGRLDIHSSTMDDGVARMRRLEDGIAIEPGGTTQLAAGGTHLILVDLKEPIGARPLFAATLVFERAGTVPVRFSVGDFVAAALASHEVYRP